MQKKITKFFKSMQNKITKSVFYFSFILDFFLKKKGYMTQKQLNSEKKEKEGRKKR